MPLSDVQIRRAKPTIKPYKLFDERGMYLLVTPTGSKLWRFKYRFLGKEKLISLGNYPDVPLAAARERRDDARRKVAAGTDPSAERRAVRATAVETFEALAQEWFTKFRTQWTAKHAETVMARLKTHVFPHVGALPIRTIDAPAMLQLLRKLEAAGKHETARRVAQICSAVFCYAIASGRAEFDPMPSLRNFLPPVQVQHRAAVTDPQKVASLLLTLDDYYGTAVVRAALRLASRVFVRPGELRKAEWTEIDLEKAEWTIPAWRMKMRQSLTVPLSRQAVAILREIEPITGHGKYVFPSARSAQRPMSDNAILSAMRRLGITKEEMSGHGFRAMARTILDEVLQIRVDLIEHQLGHAVKDPNGRAYNRTAFLKERAMMMQRWSDYLDGLKNAQRVAQNS